MDDAALGGDPHVEAYFGDLIEEVALDAPVSRVMLRWALARLQGVSADVGSLPSATSVHVGDGEEVFTLRLDDWRTLAETAELSPGEWHAAREVHRRLAVGLVGQPVVGFGPFIRLALI